MTSELLKTITRGRAPSPRRIVLYGTPGIGKSTFAASAPSPIFIPTEDGTNDIDTARFPLAKSFAEVMGYVGTLYEEQHDFQTVVVDTVDWLERLIFAQVCADQKVDALEQIGYGKGYNFAGRYWSQFFEGLDALRARRGVTLILLAHAKVERFNNPETEPYDRYTLDLHKTTGPMVIEWASEVLFASYLVAIKKEDEGFNKTRTRAMGRGERLLKTTEKPTHQAKNRLRLPDELPLEWPALQAYINAGHTIKENA
jgi:hypothetical protein